MAVGRNQIQVQWSTSNSTSISSSSNATSDEIDLSATAFAGGLTLKADNGGTPTSGDTVDFYWLQTAGDPDGASTEEYATSGHGQFLGRLDTNTEDPAILHVPVDVSGIKAKLYAESNAASNSITVSAELVELTA